MSELTIIMTMGLTIGVIFFIIGIRNRDAVFAFIGAVFLSAGGALGIALAVHQLSHGVVEDLSKLSKEIENKEIVSIEMNGLENSSNGSTYDSINSIVYIDDDGAKTKLDCSRYHLFDAKVEESADKKYHIAINKKTLRVTVYIPAGQSYTSK